MGAPGEKNEFAALLGELKDRSGLSYGVLAKRSHLSASALHRYCSGESVPAEFVPVERMGRVCRATPEELVELHRLWIVADASRRSDRRAAATFGRPPAPSRPTETGDPSPTDPSPTGPSACKPIRRTWPSGRHGRRRAVLAVALATAVLAGTAVAVDRISGTAVTDDNRTRAVGSPSEASAGPTEVSQPNTGSPSPSGSNADSDGSATRAKPDTALSGPTTPGDDRRRTGDRAATDGPPLTVSVRSNVWEHPCAQAYLVDREPEQVQSPPLEQDARRWVHAMGAVAADGQLVELTVQGRNEATVVIQSLDVRVVGKASPLDWNAYTMGVGCGGGIETRSFDVDLDAARPGAVPKAGQRGFPYTVSAADPEVLFVTAHTTTHDVRWHLELRWTSNGRQGTLRVDDAGRPFRTSSAAGRPRYDFPLGASEWIPSLFEGED
ncbi:helix-turn-helix domain-containing protein [Streptomyces sparsus]